MSPDRIHNLLLFLLSEGFDIYISVTPSPVLVLKRKDIPTQTCYPCSAFICQSGPRGSLKTMNSLLWQTCDSVLFYCQDTEEHWLVPISSIPSGGIVTLTKMYDMYRLTGRPSESPIDLDSVLKTAQDLSKGEQT